MKYPIFIPSKGRFDKKLLKTTQLFDCEKINYNLFVEPQDYKQYQKLFTNNHLINIEKNNQGICFARQFILEFAKKHKFDFYWQIDDDIKKFKISKNGKLENTSAKNAIEIMEKYVKNIENVGVLSPRRPISIFWNKSEKEWIENKGQCGAVTLTNSKTNVSYDKNLKTMEDIDFAIQNILNKFKTIALNTVAFDTNEEGSKNKKIIGGCSIDYNNGNHKKSVLLLSKKYDFVSILKRPYGLKVRINWKNI